MNDVDLKEYQIKIKTEKELINRGYTRVQEKVKVLRQKFSEAVTTGTRSGSGQIVMEHYDDLVKLWGGSPASEPLSYGCSTSEVNCNVNSEDNLSGDPCCSSTSTPSTRKRKKITAANNENNENYDPYFDEDSTSETITTNGSLTDEFVQRSTPINKNKKHKLKTNTGKNPVPKLIDNKRRHLERQLSAAQRDKMLLEDSLEDAMFRRDIASAIRESNEMFAHSMQQMSSSIALLAQGMNRSLEVISRRTIQEQSSQYRMPPAPGPFRGEFSRMLSQDHFMYDSINSNKSENNETYNNSDYFQTNKTYHSL